MTPSQLSDLPSLAAVLPQAQAENFPVALRVLRAQLREDLLAVYGFARLVDDVGDELEGGPQSRLAALDAVEAELDRAIAGTAAHPVFVALGRTIPSRCLDRQLLADLIDANRLDQRVSRYETFEQLLGYCRLSANPVGRLVLAIFGVEDPRAGRLSDLVCSGLQLVEHWQDVAEDAAAGRVYLPAEDLDRFGVKVADLRSGAPPSAAFRRLLAFETGRARLLLGEGAVLVQQLSGSARLAVAGFCGGGLAQVTAIERAGYDVLSRPVKASKGAVAAATARLLIGRRR